MRVLYPTQSITRAALAAVLASALLPGCHGSRPRTAGAEPVTEAPSQAQEDEAKPEISTLEIAASAPTDVLIDGKEVGTTPIERIQVAAGRHDVTFVDPESGNATMTVELDPGQHQRLTAPPRRAKVRETAPVEAPKADKADKADKAPAGKKTTKSK